jgi:hypothetical protein
VLVGASPGGAEATCVTHGANASAALFAGTVPVGPEPAGACDRHDTPREVAVNLKKVLTWLVVAFILFYVIQAPESSAQFVRNVGNALGDAATSLAQFVSNLA